MTKKRPCVRLCVCLCVALYLQGSIFAKRGHTLHETTHFICYRFDDLGQHAGDKVFGNSEDLKGNQKSVGERRAGWIKPKSETMAEFTSAWTVMIVTRASFK